MKIIQCYFTDQKLKIKLYMIKIRFWRYKISNQIFNKKEDFFINFDIDLGYKNQIQRRILIYK